jgi:membrane associated rhomboid family serine protease
MLSYGFLHGDLLHLFFNMLGLWMFGSELERLWGRHRYWQFLLASLLAAAVTQLLVTWLTRSMVPTVGASGALFGLLLAFGMLFPNRIIVPLIPPIPMKGQGVVVYGGWNCSWAFWTPRRGAFRPPGGMLGGFLMLRYWRGQSPFRRDDRFWDPGRGIAQACALPHFGVIVTIRR